MEFVVYVRIDDEKSTQSDAGLFDQDSIIARNGLVKIGQQWIIQTT